MIVARRSTSIIYIVLSVLSISVMDLGYFTSVRAVVPEALNGFVSQSQWDGICSTFRSVDDDATFKACLGEWACCCLTGCFCVFFGHSAFHSYFVKDRLQG